MCQPPLSTPNGLRLVRTLQTAFPTARHRSCNHSPRIAALLSPALYAHPITPSRTQPLLFVFGVLSSSCVRSGASHKAVQAAVSNRQTPTTSPQQRRARLRGSTWGQPGALIRGEAVTCHTSKGGSGVAPFGGQKRAAAGSGAVESPGHSGAWALGLRCRTQRSGFGADGRSALRTPATLAVRRCSRVAEGRPDVRMRMPCISGAHGGSGAAHRNLRMHAHALGTNQTHKHAHNGNHKQLQQDSKVVRQENSSGAAEQP